MGPVAATKGELDMDFGSSIDAIVTAFVDQLLKSIFAFLEALFASLAEGFHYPLS
jgi:hypothetical protein